MSGKISLEDGVGISRFQKQHVLTLSILIPSWQMLEDSNIAINTNMKKCWDRIDKQSKILFATIPAYNRKVLRQISRVVNYTWNEQDDMKYSAITMLNCALYLVETCYEGARAARSPHAGVWQRMAGSVFTLIKHVDSPYWENPQEKEQIIGEMLACRILEQLRA